MHAAERDTDRFQLADALNILRRRRGVIVACVAIITTVSAITVFQITPRYTAEADVMLDPQKMQVIDIQAVLSGLPIDSAIVSSEIEVLRSNNLAQAVAKKADLIAVPEFNARLRKPTFLSTVLKPVHQALAAVKSVFTSVPNAPATDHKQAEFIAVAQALQSHLKITNDGRSYVLGIRLQSENPQLAATLAADYADAYLNGQLDAKFAAIQRASQWLSDHLSELRAQAEASDRAVQLFAAAHNLTLTQGSSETVTSQQISEINTQLVLASADLAQKEANLRQVQDLLKTGGVSAAAQVLSSPLIQNLREQETRLLTRQAELATRYKPEHPEMINIRAQLHDLDLKIQAEINRIVHGIQGDVVGARAKVASLRQSLAELQRSGAETGADVQLRELQREAQANRALYESFLNRFKQTSAQQGIQQPDARIISEPIVPTSPSYPKKLPLIAFAFVGSLMVGVFAAFGVERLDNGFNTGEQFEGLAHVPVLGLEPNLFGKEPPQDAVIRHPVSSYSEAIRSIRTALRYSDVDTPPKVVLVTSSLSHEGKTVFALSLARSVAKSGGRALLIDCDLRRPSLAKIFNVDPQPGLLAFFDEAEEKSTIIRVDPQSGCHFIVTAPGTPNPQDLLGSKHMRALIDVMRDRYDLIVLDTPPTLAVSDALVLSHAADATIFLVRWAKTARPVALGSLKLFRSLGGKLAGVVLSRVDMRRHATYGYGDPGYYYGYSGRYRGYETYGDAGKPGTLNVSTRAWQRTPEKPPHAHRVDSA